MQLVGHRVAARAFTDVRDVLSIRCLLAMTRLFAVDDKEFHCQAERPARAAAIFVERATTFYCPQIFLGTW